MRGGGDGGDGGRVRAGRLISSPRNPLIRRIERIRAGKERGAMLVEGRKLLFDALAAGIEFEALLLCEELCGRETAAEAAARLVRAGGPPPYRLSEAAMRRASGVETPPGLLAVARRPARAAALLDPPARPLAVAAGLRDPGNLGTVLRAAEAAGLAGAVLLERTADPFKEKALRAAAGSAFRLPILRGVSAPALVERAAAAGAVLVGLDARADCSLFDPEWLGPEESPWIAVGGEASGLPPELALQCRRVRIPMAGRVESLNAGAAAALVFYEAARRLGLAGRGHAPS